MLVISLGPTYDYGSVNTGSSPVQGFTLTNSGAATATAITSPAPTTPFFHEGGSFPGTGGTCGATLATGSNCVFNVEFTPVAAGLVSSPLSVDYHDGTAPQSSAITIQGTGVPLTYNYLDSGKMGTNIALDGPALQAIKTSTDISSVLAFNGKSSGQWYFEVTIDAAPGGVSDFYVGLGMSSTPINSTVIGGTADSWGLNGTDGKIYNNG